MDSKKIMRKQAKALAAVRRDFGIGGSESPTKYICVCNAGLMNGMTEEALLEILIQFGAVEKLVMPANKSYAFSTFSDEKAAEQALKSFNGCETFDGRTLYAASVDSVPDLDPPYEFSPPPGMLLVDSFVSELEEEALLAWLDSIEVITPGSLKHRRVLHFGYEFDYAVNAVDPEKPLVDRPIPTLVMPILHRISENLGYDVLPDQLTINVYEPGQGIPPHVDTHSPFVGPIYSLSLGSGICMQFRHPSKRDFKERAVFLPSRSLLVLDGESRYLWSHAIVPRKLDLVPTSIVGADRVRRNSISSGGITVRPRSRRVSLTFRKVNPAKDCHCDYPGQCDFQKANKKLTCSEVPADIPEEVAEELERNHVLKVYDQIAEHFSETRFKPWPGIVKFLESLESHSLLLDVGCGNGKYCDVRSDITTIGCDASRGLLNIASQKANGGVFLANCLRIGTRDDSFDAAICIAVLHHLSTESRRRDALAEICRVVRPGCKGLVYVWAKEQELENLKSHYLRKKAKRNSKRVQQKESENFEDSSWDDIGLVAATFADCQVSSSGCSNDQLRLPVHASRTNFKHADLFVPWTFKRPASVSGRGSRLCCSGAGSPAVIPRVDVEATEEGTNDREESSSEPEIIPTGESIEDHVHHRFYHVFARGELEALARSVDGLSVEEVYYEQGNWCLIFKKRHPSSSPHS